jgi:hypothetical protein
MRRILGVLVAGAVVLGATVAVAQESPEGKTKEPAARAKRALGFRIVHGDSVALGKDGETVEVRHQRGVIESVSDSSITIESPDGYKQTYRIDGDTIVRERRQQSTVGDLKAGERAGVVAVKSGDGYTAKLIKSPGELRVPREARREKAKAT